MRNGLTLASAFVALSLIAMFAGELRTAVAGIVGACLALGFALFLD